MIEKATQTVPENGFPACPKCGGILHWNADFMASEVGLADESDSGHNDIVNSLHCPDCERAFYYRQSADGGQFVDVSMY